MKYETIKDSKSKAILKGIKSLNEIISAMQLPIPEQHYLFLAKLFKYVKHIGLTSITFDQLNNNTNDSSNDYDNTLVCIKLSLKDWIFAFFKSLHHYINGNEYFNNQNEAFILLSFALIKEVSRNPPIEAICFGDKSELNQIIFYFICDYYIILREKKFFINQFSRILSLSESSIISFKFYVILKKICLKHYDCFQSNYNEIEMNNNNSCMNKEMMGYILLYLKSLKIKCELSERNKTKGYFLLELLFVKSNQVHPKELDGSSINGIFTVLNICNDYFNTLKNNIIAFSSSYELLCFINKRTIPLTPLFKEMKSMLYSYCIRIFDQSENFLESIKTKGIYDQSTEFNINLIEATVLEALKLINILCKVDPSLINSVFMRIKQAHERIAMKQSGLCFLEILQFFIDNYTSIIVDLDSYVSDFIRIKLKENYKSEVLVFLTFEFLYKNTIILKTQTHIFTSFFPLLIKIFAYFPKYVHTKYFELMNYMTQPETISEEFNYILDLPSIILLIENFNCFKPNDANMKPFKQEEMLINEDYVKLSQLLLRDVAYEKQYQYAIDYYKIYNTQLKYLFEVLISTSRVHSITKILPKFINKFFEVVIDHNEISNALELTQLIIERFSNFYGNESFKHSIRILLISKLEEIFKKWPQIVNELYDYLLMQIKADYNNSIRKELIIFLLWSIGEFLSNQSLNSFQDTCIKNTFDCLQIILIENISTFSQQTLSTFTSIKNDNELEVNDLVYQFTNYFINQTTDEQILNERIMTVLIITLSKLSFKFKSFTGRILKCFVEIRQTLKNKTIRDTIDEMIVGFDNISIGTEYLI